MKNESRKRGICSFRRMETTNFNETKYACACGRKINGGGDGLMTNVRVIPLRLAIRPEARVALSRSWRERIR